MTFKFVPTAGPRFGTLSTTSAIGNSLFRSGLKANKKNRLDFANGGFSDQARGAIKTLEVMITRQQAQANPEIRRWLQDELDELKADLAERARSTRGAG